MLSNYYSLCARQIHLTEMVQEDSFDWKCGSFDSNRTMLYPPTQELAMFVGYSSDDFLDRH